MASNKKVYRVKADQILSNVKGWLSLQLSDGSVVKARKAQVVVIEGGITNRRVGDRRFNCSGYTQVKSAEGNSSMDNGDELATKLRGQDLDAVYKLASKALGETITALKGKYGHLNLGMQRMCLGNRMRASV